jgi:hypothetical protein
MALQAASPDHRLPRATHIYHRPGADCRSCGLDAGAAGLSSLVAPSPGDDRRGHRPWPACGAWICLLILLQRNTQAAIADFGARKPSKAAVKSAEGRRQLTLRCHLTTDSTCDHVPSHLPHPTHTHTQLSMDPGLKGCQFLLGTLPAWISLTEREKMEV